MTKEIFDLPPLNPLPVNNAPKKSSLEKNKIESTNYKIFKSAATNSSFISLKEDHQSLEQPTNRTCLFIFCFPLLRIIAQSSLMWGGKGGEQAPKPSKKALISK